MTDDEERVLLVCHGDHWTIPGGAVDRGERFRDAAQREVREETGINTHVHELRAITEQTLFCEDEQVQFYYATFDATAKTTKTTSTPGLEDEGIESVGWYRNLSENTIDHDLITDER